MSRKANPSKLISWNVNGLRAVLKKGFAEFLQEASPDVVCLQEIKANPEQIEDMGWANGYEVVWNPALKKGYSGTAILTRVKPLSTVNGIGVDAHDQEGRVVTAEFPKFYLVTV
ncbi:MAG: exodeoxyribonuclease III, partial [Verrucomicrobiales bacterium]